MTPRNRYIIVVPSRKTGFFLTFISSLFVKYRVNGNAEVIKRGFLKTCIYVVTNTGRMYSVLFGGALFNKTKKSNCYCRYLEEVEDENMVADNILNLYRRERPPVLSLILFIILIFLVFLIFR